MAIISSELIIVCSQSYAYSFVTIFIKTFFSTILRSHYFVLRDYTKTHMSGESAALGLIQIQTPDTEHSNMLVFE